jgi:outer membrane receptor protein involved in Fe transport
LATELNYLGSRFPISDPRNDLPKVKAYVRVDLKARYQWKWATSWITLANLFDRQYSDYAAASSGGVPPVGYYPARGRNLVAGFSLEY